MTDLISKLADDLTALINASPRSPTKEQIVEVLRKHSNYTHPAYVCFVGAEPMEIKWSEPSDATSWTPIAQEQSDAALDSFEALQANCATCGTDLRICGCQASKF